MYHLIHKGDHYLTDFGEYWASWSKDESLARRFWDKEEARVLAQHFEGDLTPRQSVS